MFFISANHRSRRESERSFLITSGLILGGAAAVIWIAPLAWLSLPLVYEGSWSWLPAEWQTPWENQWGMIAWLGQFGMVGILWGAVATYFFSSARRWWIVMGLVWSWVFLTPSGWLLGWLALGCQRQKA